MATDSKSNLDKLRIDRTERGEPGSPRWPWLLAVLLLATGAALAWWFLRDGRAFEVTTTTVYQEELTSGGRGASVLEASGYVTARRKATVSAKRTGKIVELWVEEGMRIEKGQILARLDDSLLLRQLALAQAQLQATRSTLAELDVRRDEAERNLGRSTKLLAEEVTTQAQVDADRASLDTLIARLAAAADQITVSERQVLLQREQLRETVIRAPFTGVAISKDAQPGEMISPISAGGFTRTGICTLVDMSSLEIEVDVNETYIQRVLDGQPVEARLDAYPDWTIAAHVITIVPTADRQKATMKVRIGFDRLEPRILPDMGVKVAFLESKAETEGADAAPRLTLLTPKASLRRDGERHIVFVVHNDQVERRAVTVGQRRGDSVEIEAGLNHGDQVVLNPPEELTDADRVRVSHDD